jgi:hypothetical protein
VLAAVALAIFLLAFALGRSTASSAAPRPDLVPVRAAPARLELPQLAEAAPLPGLAAPARQTARSTPAPRRQAPAKRPASRPASPSTPVVIVGSG